MDLPLLFSSLIAGGFHEENDEKGQKPFFGNLVLLQMRARVRFLSPLAMAMAISTTMPWRWSSGPWRSMKRSRYSCSASLGSRYSSCSAMADSTKDDLVDRYVDLLLRWNERMNLTSVRDREQVMVRHVADSLALLPVIDDALMKHCRLDAASSLTVVDVGSGAGLPGIIIGIARPSWQVTLIESIQKKCDFLDEAVRSAALQNVKVIRARAEDMGQEKRHRETYHIAVARAVAEMRVLAELCLPLVCVGGIMVAAKGASPQEELDKAKKAVNILGGLLLPTCNVTSESPLGMRTAAVCLKRARTPAMYPRRPGVPSKQPL